MSRRMSVLVAAVAFTTTPFVYAAQSANDRDCTREERSRHEDVAQREVGSPTPAPVTLAELFAVPAGDPSIETEDGVSAPGPLEVVVARIASDGKPVMACVDRREAAERFLKTPVEQLATKKAKEQ